MKNKKWLLLIIPGVAIHFFLMWQYYSSNNDNISDDLSESHTSDNTSKNHNPERYFYENGEHRESAGYDEYYITKKYLCADDRGINYYVTSTIGHIKSTNWYRATSTCTFNKKIVENYENWTVTSSFIMEFNKPIEAMMTSEVECINNEGKNYSANVHFNSMVFYACPSIGLEEGIVNKGNFPAITVKNDELIDLADTCMRLTTLCGQETMNKLFDNEITLW